MDLFINISIITSMLFALLVIFILAFYWFLKEKYDYWRKKGACYEEPTLFFGCLKEFAFARKSNVTIFKEIYEKHQDKPYVGIYMGTKPALILRNPELIREVLMTDFSNFNSRGYAELKKDILADNVGFMNGLRWRLVRQKLTPAFTSGKLRNMIPLLADCDKHFQNYLKESVDGNSDVNIETVCSDFTTSVIASCAFGIDSKTLSDEYTPFREVGRNFFDQKLRLNLVFTFEAAMPWIFKYIPFSRFRKIDGFFVSIFKNVIKQREESKKPRNDFLDICLELKNNKTLKDQITGKYSIEVTDEFLAAQAFLFFLAGHETSASTIAYSLYELAHHPEYLEKLHKEVDDLLAKNGEINNECLENSEFLDRIIQETLRKYPPVGYLQRQCNAETHHFKDLNLTIDKGALCMIPILALQRDPKYYPEPLLFNPYRFEEKGYDLNFNFLPFGSGPRQCLGLRLAILQVKTGLISVLREFTVQPKAAYEPELEMQPVSLAVKPKKIDIKIVKRVN